MSATLVDVFLPGDSPVAPKVQAEFVTASGGAVVIWQVFNANPDVFNVEIEFGLASDKYFGSGPDGNRIVKEVPPDTCAVIHGTVPLTPSLKRVTKVRRDKYTIRGRTASNHPVEGVELDPVIVVKEP